MMTMGGLRMADSGAWKVKATESRIRGRIKYFVIIRGKRVVGWRAKFLVIEILALEAFECRPLHNRKSRANVCGKVSGDICWLPSEAKTNTTTRSEKIR